jgi:hypothetical protein
MMSRQRNGRISNRCLLTVGLILCHAIPSMAQAAPFFRSSPDGAWAALEAAPKDVRRASSWIAPRKYAAVMLDRASMETLLKNAPIEGSAEAKAAPAIVGLPMPDGGVSQFAVVESPIMEPDLAARFPRIKTYSGSGLDDRAATVRFDLTPLGFHAQILSPLGAVYVDPISRDGVTHASYYKRDFLRPEDDMICAVADDASIPPPLPLLMSNGTTLRTYRLACAATGEYTAFFGGTVTDGQAAIVAAINRVNGIYETELCIRLVLVANNSSLVYTDPETDPYTNNNGLAMLTQNQANVDSVIGSANYDIGHVFSTGGGGVAAIGVVGVAGQKARGTSGKASPTGDPFWVDMVAHEIGHQFGANHTFNSTCGNPNALTAYERGSGSTIMSFAGRCGSDDLQPHPDPYFHWISLDEISSYISSGAGAGTPTATGNAIPTVNAGADYTIPAHTPFALTGSAADANGDTLTYCWEETDLGPATTVSAVSLFFSRPRPHAHVPEPGQSVGRHQQSRRGLSDDQPLS